ncbi:hypothetical protein VCHE48_1782 [Vibrio cholerae HE48]|nr:hypothetical protein VCHE48_1782 [Vibrio cholerae HE48]EJH55781.1 hypothetical protein VCHC43B1_0827 [Vibrio cholerae HC-43B1]
MADDRIFPFLLETAAVLVMFVHPRSHRLSMLMGMNSLAAYLQRQVVWVYIINVGQN